MKKFGYTIRPLLKAVSAYALIFGLLFLIIALAEHRFAVWQILSTEEHDLTSTADGIAEKIGSIDAQHLGQYRQWDNPAQSSFILISASGELIDIKRDVDNLVTTSVSVDRYVKPGPAMFTSDLGETWLLENRRINGGNVVGGIVAQDLIGLQNPAGLLRKEMLKYGRSAEDAFNFDPTAIRNYISGVLVVMDDGRIAATGSGVPLHVQLLVPANLLDGVMHQFDLKGHLYELLARHISTGKSSTVVLAFDDFDTEAIDQSLHFNIALAAIAWVIALGAYASLLIKDNREKQRLGSLLQIPTQTLIAQGENAPVEFKSTLRYDLRAGKNDLIMTLAVLKTLAAFMNTSGGVLLIGVKDDGTVIGIGPDKFPNADRALLHLTSIIGERIGSAYGAYLDMHVQAMEDNLRIIRVNYQRASVPAYVRTDNGLKFYVRTGPSTTELAVNEVHPYIKTHFTS